jgi:peptidoglycan DL-endopeptidase CwlO
VRLRVTAGLVLAIALLASPAVAQPEDPDQVEAGVAPGPLATDPRPGEAFADPEVAKLQRTASDVQRELADLTNQIHAAEQDLATATAAAETATAERERADAVVAAQQAEVDRYSAVVYSTLAQPSEIRALVSAEHPEDFLDGSGMLAQLRADQDTRLTGAVRRQSAARAAERTATDARAEASARKSELDQRNADAGNRAAAVSAELRGVVSDTNAAVVAQQKAQRQRNEKTAANWQNYLDRLSAAGVDPPPAAALRDPARLPAGLEQLPGEQGPQAGVARRTLPSGEGLLVLPEEVVTAVTTSVGALGKPYVPGTDGVGPAAFSCDGLVTAAYSAGGLTVPPSAAEQLAGLSPVRRADIQPGDLVFLGPKRYGVQGVGIVLDGRTMLTADGRLAGVVVTDLPGGDTVLGFARPSLPGRAPVDVPEQSDGGLVWRCGGVEVPARGPDEAAGAWGGYPNGFIPLTALCPIGSANGAGSHVLRCDAAAAFGAMDQAYAAEFGRQICVTDSYRTFDAQVRLYSTKPALAAVPGTSNHGWALAVDLCDGANSYGSPQYAWLMANAPLYGWANPGWARQGGGREEPWHWEFAGF